MGLDVYKDNLGFGVRSWRYAAVVTNGKIETWFIEPGMIDDSEEDPYFESSPHNVLAWIKEQNANDGSKDPNKAPF
jgi:peroxiredoxin